MLRKERDGIWAAAVAAYKSGERWWLSKEETNLSEQNNENFQIVDEWESAIADYTKFLDRTSVTEILVKCFDIEVGKMDRSSQMRVATILTSLDWKKVGIRCLEGTRQQCWERCPTDDECDNKITTPEVAIEVESPESTGISRKSQPHNLSKETFEISEKSSEEAVDSAPNEPADNILEKKELEKDHDQGCDVVTCPADQGFEGSQPQTESEGCDPGDQDKDGNRISSSENANLVCDTFETETIKIKIEENDASNDLVEPSPELEVFDNGRSSRLDFDSSKSRSKEPIEEFKLIRLNKGWELKYEVRNSLDLVIGWIDSDGDDLIAKNLNGNKKTCPNLNCCYKFLGRSF